MGGRAIPRLLGFLRHYPVLLAAALGAVNRLRRLAASEARARTSLMVVALTGVVGALLGIVAQAASVALAVPWLVGHWGLVVAVATLYSAALIGRHRHALEAAGRRSWLVATPRLRHGARSWREAEAWLPLGSRLLPAAAIANVAALNADVTIVATLELSGLLAVGTVVGMPVGWWYAGRSRQDRRQDSRYVRRGRTQDGLAPSAAALARWPIAQAFAWSRPENARLVLVAAVLAVPGGTSAAVSAGLLVLLFLASYLLAVLRAIPYVAREASAWLRSTPLKFWDFARPLAGRALLHQLCGTLVAAMVLVALGSPLSAVLYGGAVWATLVLLTTAIALADCYRGRASTPKLALALAATLLAENRGHGLGVSLALALGVWHLRLGANHERA